MSHVKKRNPLKVFIIGGKNHTTEKEMNVRPFLPAFLVFAALLALVVISWHTAKRDITLQESAKISENASFIEGTIKQRFSIYEDTLRAANGLFLSSDVVSRDEWRSFVESMQLSKRYPGIRGVAYAELVQRQDKELFISKVQAEGLSNYTIYPAADKPIYAPVLYIVPIGGQNQDDRNAPILGFDMYSEPKRLEALNAAADTGEPTLTGTINLVQNGPTPARGFILAVPLYQKNMPITTVANRRAALRGYFYAPFISSGVFSSLFNFNDDSFGFTIYDGNGKTTDKIYDSLAGKDTSLYHTVRKNTISLYGRKWTIEYKARANIVPYSVRSRPINVIMGGTVFAFALSAVIYLLIQRRTRALAYTEQKKLEEAKDELLSLASHQLRTPATAVKQYVSMVKDGFAGDISSEQRKLLTMAYESNERQLTIVDDLLYVARIDAGQAILRPEAVNLAALIKSVIEDLHIVIKSRHQKVIFKNPQRAITISADPQYLRMIIENLLSNASKYSHENKNIRIKIQDFANSTQVEITDSGVGIEEKDYQNVFLKFSRIPNELTRQIAGSGIGLYLAKQLAILHGGDITFVSVFGRGSSFTLTLPKNRKK